jgi:nicotinamidase-related amidase
MTMPTRRDAPFEKGATALLFVDMQKIWTIPGLDPDHPDADPESYFYKRARDLVVPNQVRILTAARRAGVDVLHTIIRSLTKDGRDRSLDHKLTPIHIAVDAPEGDVIDELAPTDNEIVLPKTSSGVFNSTNIDYVLRNLGCRNLIIAGQLTDQCVDMAVRDAADRGYLVSLVADACGTYTEERHQAALRAFGGYCWVTDTDEIVSRLEGMAS